jgi:hypothetical protein
MSTVELRRKRRRESGEEREEGANKEIEERGR